MVSAYPLKGQVNVELETGTVTYVSSRNVYVKFHSTEKLNIGDTLYIQQGDTLVPALVVQNKSSTSTVSTPLIDEKIEANDEVVAKFLVVKEVKKAKNERIVERLPEKVEAENPEAESPTDEPEVKAEKIDPNYKQNISGRLSAASYSNISSFQSSHRLQYSFSFRGKNLNNSKWSVENFIVFRHRVGEWEQVRENIGNALKVYSLSVKYDFDPVTSLTIGRKINPKVSSMGAIDGLQFEKGIGQFVFGAILGSRPDFSDYGLNPNLLQMGAYVGFVSNSPEKYQQSTFGFMEQRNRGRTDRRFVYFQHSGDLLKNLNLFSSFEFDLYEKLNGEQNNTLRLTNLYISLRYRMSKKLRLSMSYDNRRNIVYYESYKNFIDQLLENVSRQGMRLDVNYRISKTITWGINSSMRFQSDQKNAFHNINTYFSITRIPVVKMSANIRATFLQSNYMKSRIFAVRVSRDIIKGRLSGEAYFSTVEYQYKTYEYSKSQQIAGMNLNLRLLKNTALHLYYEGSFSNKKQEIYRYNAKIIQRF